MQRSGEGEGRAIRQALAINTTLTQLNLCVDSLGGDAMWAMGQLLAVNRVLPHLDLNKLGTKGARKIRQALQANSVLATLHLDYSNALTEEIETRFSTPSCWL
jgi:hypothetical protein